MLGGPLAEPQNDLFWKCPDGLSSLFRSSRFVRFSPLFSLLSVSLGSSACFLSVRQRQTERERERKHFSVWLFVPNPTCLKFLTQHWQDPPLTEGHKAFTKPRPLHSKEWMGQRTCAGWGACLHPMPRAKQSKAKRKHPKLSLLPDSP